MITYQVVVFLMLLVVVVKGTRLDEDRRRQRNR